MMAIESLATLLIPVARLVSHQKHLGRGNAFRVGQVGVDHEGAPQRHGEHDPEDSA